MSNQLANYVRSAKEYDPTKIMEILNAMNRTDIIVFLAWNDPNGTYLDIQCGDEFIPLTECEAKLLAFKQLWENAPLPECSYIIARTTGDISGDNNTDEYQVIRGIESNAYQQAKAIYNEFIADEETSICSIAKVIFSTDY